MEQQNTFSFKKVALAVTVASLLMSGSAQAYGEYDDEYDDYNDAYLALIPLILYSALSEPRVVVRKKIYRQGRLIPRYSREPRHYREHRRSRSRDHYKYPRHGLHHRRF